MQFAQVGRLGGPVVHLYVDVGMHVGVPGGIAHIVPDALQVVGSQKFAVAGDGQIAAVVEIQLLQETCLGIVEVLQRAIVVDEFVGGTVALGIQVQRHTACVGQEIGNVVLLYVGEALLACGIHTRHHLLAQVVNGNTCGTALGIGGKVCAGSHVHHHLTGTDNLYAVLSGQHMSSAYGHDTHSSLIGHSLQLTVEVGIGQAACICGINHGAGIDVLAGSEGEEQMQLLLAGSLIACHHHLVGIADEICAVVDSHVFRAGAMNTADAFLQVQAADIVLHLAVLAGQEHATEILHKDAAEVLVLAIATAKALHVAGLTRPEGLLVELDFVLVQASEQATAQLTVTDGQRILHPYVLHTGSRRWHVVPKGHWVSGGKILGTCRKSRNQSHAHGTCSETFLH